LTLVGTQRRTIADRANVSRRETATGHVVGLAIAIAGAAMCASAVVEKLQGGTEAVHILASGLVVGVPGLALWARTKAPARIPVASIFAAVLSGWIAFVLVSTVPYLVTHTFVAFDRALFESVSGFTTTSASVLRPVDGTAPGILFWRAATQWIGGIGVVVFAVSVLPFLGVGVAQLTQTARIGPASESLGPRVSATATRLLPIYLGFTVVLAGAYDAAGMKTFDAVTHAFTTVSTGGFSTHDASFAYFRSAPLEWIAIAAMMLAGGSYALYWRALRGKPLVVLRSAEFRAYIGITAMLCAATVGWNGTRHGFTASAVRRTIFTTVSITSTTGYRMLDFNRWATPIQLLLVFAMGLGAMAGSAAGGFKVGRLLAVLSYARRQLFTQLHPRAVGVVRFGREIVPEAVVTRVVGFFGLFMAIGGLGTFLVAAFGADMRTAISTVASAIGNVGPALGAAGPTTDYLGVSAGARGVLMVVMLIGRLEVFPVLLGIVPLVRIVTDALPRPVKKVFLRVARG
jgi:trk system potassium uptake protein TrkH